MEISAFNSASSTITSWKSLFHNLIVLVEFYLKFPWNNDSSYILSEHLSTYFRILFRSKFLNAVREIKRKTLHWLYRVLLNLGLTDVASKLIDLDLTDVINYNVSCNSLLVVFYRPNICTYVRYIWSMAQNYSMYLLKLSSKFGQQKRKSKKKLYILHTNQATNDIDNFQINLILNSMFNIGIEQCKLPN